MKYLIVFFCCLASQAVIGQATVQENPKMTLDERYQVMKSRGQTYEEYKVIKEFVLDGVWKITRDSIRANKMLLQASGDSIARFELEVKRLQLALQQKEIDQAGIVYDSTHISLFGFSLLKGVFLGIGALIVIGLVLVLGFMVGRLKIMHTGLQEKTELANATNSEFEEYKRKALDKQTKLSRELQNERNKLLEMKRS